MAQFTEILTATDRVQSRNVGLQEASVGIFSKAGPSVDDRLVWRRGAPTEHAKDDKYWRKRHRNTAAARRSRLKRRNYELANAVRLQELANINRRLSSELRALKQHFGLPLEETFPYPDSADEHTSSQAADELGSGESVSINSEPTNKPWISSSSLSSTASCTSDVKTPLCRVGSEGCQEFKSSEGQGPNGQRKPSSPPPLIPIAGSRFFHNDALKAAILNRHPSAGLVNNNEIQEHQFTEISKQKNDQYDITMEDSVAGGLSRPAVDLSRPVEIGEHEPNVELGEGLESAIGSFHCSEAITHERDHLACSNKRRSTSPMELNSKCSKSLTSSNEHLKPDTSDTPSNEQSSNMEEDIRVLRRQVKHLKKLTGRRE